MKDKSGREISYLRISITDRCNYRCFYCMPEGIQKTSHSDILTYEQIILIAKEAYDLGIRKFRITGGEPLVRLGAVQFIKDLHEKFPDAQLVMTTNGELIPKYARELKDSGLSRVNISLDSLKEDRFKSITKGGDLSKVLEGIRLLKEFKMVPVKINVVLVKGVNDDEIMDFIKLTKDKDLIVRFIELMPIGSSKEFDKGYISLTETIDSIPSLSRMDSDPAEPARYYRYLDYEGMVGFIQPVSCGFCNYCNRIRLTSDGLIKPCLHSDDAVDLKPFLENKEKLKAALESAIVNKPPKHEIGSGEFKPIHRAMHRIGG